MVLSPLAEVMIKLFLRVYALLDQKSIHRVDGGLKPFIAAKKFYGLVECHKVLQLQIFLDADYYIEDRHRRSTFRNSFISRYKLSGIPYSALKLRIQKGWPQSRWFEALRPPYETVTINGDELTLTEAAKRYDISPQTLKYRIKHWPESRWLEPTHRSPAQP
jgi:hypothetical protein